MPTATPASPSIPPERDVRAATASTARRAPIDALLLLFAIAFTVCILAPVFTRGFFPLYPTLPWSSLVDFFTPVILVPLYGLLFFGASAAAPSRRESVVFLVVAAVWVLGHGVHLAANSIGYAMRPLPPSYATRLAHLYDEVLGHYFWHGGILGLSTLITLRSVGATASPVRGASGGASAIGGAGDERQPSTRARGLTMRAAAALLYGFTYFLVIVEGGTGPIGIPFAALFVLVSLARARATLARDPLHGFFFAAHLFASILFVIWASIHRGLPQFSEVGIID